MGAVTHALGIVKVVHCRVLRQKLLKLAGAWRLRRHLLPNANAPLHVVGLTKLGVQIDSLAASRKAQCMGHKKSPETHLHED